MWAQSTLRLWLPLYVCLLLGLALFSPKTQVYAAHGEPTTCSVAPPADWIDKVQTAAAAGGWTYDWSDVNGAGIWLVPSSQSTAAQLYLLPAGVNAEINDTGTATSVVIKNTSGATKVGYSFNYQAEQNAVFRGSQLNLSNGQSYAVGNMVCQIAVEKPTYLNAYPYVLNELWPRADTSTQQWASIEFAPAPEPPASEVQQVYVTNTDLATQEVTTDLTPRDLQFIALLLTGFLAYTIIKQFRWQHGD